MNGFTDKFLSMMGHHPRNGAADGYPFDFDASLRHVRPPTGYDYFPTHSNADNFQKLGLVSGFLNQMDQLVFNQSYGKLASGPIVSTLPENLQWQINIQGLDKQMPTQ